MGDEQEGQVECRCELTQQRQDFGLDRRVEGGRGLLKNQRDVRAAHAAQLMLRQSQQVSPAQGHRAADDAARGLHQAQDRQRRHGLAAARFTDQSERVAFANGKTHAVDRDPDAPIEIEDGREIVDLQKDWRPSSEA